MYSYWDFDHRLNVNGNNHDNNRNGYAFGIALDSKTYNHENLQNFYNKIVSVDNLYLAYKKARKGKTKKNYVKEFSEDLINNLIKLNLELISFKYKPKPLEIFIIRDPKTRKISKSDFKDRIIHHALCNIIEPIFDKTFINDSYANRKGKGTLAALNRFDKFKRKVSRNGKINGWFNNNQVKGYCLKADIKHYFEEINHNVLLKIIERRIKDNNIIWLIKKILSNYEGGGGEQQKGMPIGNLTSQFFANVYLNELDYFIKHKLKAKYYIRYVDDFVILHSNKKILEIYKDKINKYLNYLKLELHPNKSKIISLTRPINFVGFRIFYHYKLLKKFNRKNIQRKLNKFNTLFKKDKINYDNIYESIQGSFAYMSHANTYHLKNKLVKQIEKNFPNEISSIEINRYLKNP